ncbi:hypothetical protein [Nocardiopsis suaedae]|uniref:Uncharacterized protein n=1 Tax=Nocardiopsis suaedae TaxID=3018444 RepID=A0ABT4TWS2_9ACTN|nr:hypothetical protein [Nocardiopsis suaedae]MDA2808866.1 hypothetical protein [Nocardiopsis suaedae]
MFIQLWDPYPGSVAEDGGTSAEEQEWYAGQEAVLWLLAWRYRDNEHFRSEWAPAERDLRGLDWFAVQ